MFEQALSDVKIIDLTHYIAGPYCAKLLADYGADVIKVEKPGEGDGARKLGPFLKDDPHLEKIRKPAVRLGEHNEYVYKEVLGVSDEEYARLEKEGHIGMDFAPHVR